MKNIKNNSPHLKWYGQKISNSDQRTDEYMYYNHLQGISEGFFVECGALNGLSISNCLFLEEFLGWKGINIEPSQAFNELIRRRPNSINLRYALSDTDGDIIDFCEDTTNFARSTCIEQKTLSNHSINKIKVPTITWRTLVSWFAIEKVDFFSLDVEGMESKVLDGMKDASVLPEIILIEILNSNSDVLHQKLLELGYTRIDQFHIDAVYKRNTNAADIHTIVSNNIDLTNQTSSLNFLTSPLNFLKIKKPLYEYENVLVCPRSGCVFNLQGEPIIETLHDFLFWNPSTLNLNVKSDDLEKEVQKRKQTFVNPLQQKVLQDLNENNILNLGNKITGIHLLSGFGWYPFGHFFDYLQKLFVIENRKYCSPLVLHSRSYAIKNFTEHLNACGVSNEMLFECRHDFPTILVKKLVYITPFIPTTLTSETAKWMAEKYINYFTYQDGQNKFKADENKRFFLFLDRHKVRPGSRSIINYSEVMSWVKSKDFKIFDGTESLAEIVFYFSRAKFIFGAHGAMFANTIFAPQDCTITELCPDKRINKCFFLQPKNCQNYYWLKSESDEQNNVLVDIDLIESYFNS